MASHRVCSVPLPNNFRVADVLNFHGRDPLAVAERVDEHSLQKGLLWHGQPACLTLRFAASQAAAQLAIDGQINIGQDVLARWVRHLLGLTQRIEDFEHTYRAHPLLGPLIAHHPGLRVQQSATPFEALTWAITGQQISLAAATSVRRKLIEVAGVRHSSGLACYPDASRVAALSATDLRQAGYSQVKAQTLSLVSCAVAADQIPLEAWMTARPITEMRAQLLSLRGIGPWTVNYTLLRGFGWLDGSLHGDAAVRRQLRRLLGATEKVTEEFTHNWLAEFVPWRALVAAHLWAIPSELLT